MRAPDPTTRAHRRAIADEVLDNPVEGSVEAELRAVRDITVSLFESYGYTGQQARDLAAGYTLGRGTFLPEDLAETFPEYEVSE